VKRAAPWLLPALGALFFLSGASGLVYQVLWLRLLSLVFGVTVYAASTVLASFMGGLAIGSVLAGRLADRARHSLRLFGLTEIAIGLLALATPTALDAVQALYAMLARALPDQLAALTLVRFACALAVLLVPTALMGATLPLVVSSSLVRGGHIGHRVGVLYGANTAGAIVGATLTGFFLIGQYGIRSSFLLAAAVNGVVGVSAVLLSVALTRASPVDGSQREAASGAPATASQALRPATRRTVLTVFALSGFAALALEVVWFRLLVLYLPATTYAFTTMLATVLAGIAAGSALVAPWLRKDRDWISTLASVQAMTGFSVLLSAAFLAWTYQAGWQTSETTQASIVAILPATLLMGVAFPIGVRLWAGDSRGLAGDDPGERLGRLYAANVGGAILGALAGGFILLPALGTRASLVVCAGIYVLASALLRAVQSRLSLLITCVTGVVLLAIGASLLPDPFASVIRRRYGPTERLFWREEGVQTTASVNLRPFGGLTLYLDGLHQANDTADMVKLHRLIGHLPMLLHPAPREALVVGLGGGATAGAVSQHPDVQVDVVELSDSVRRAARFFAHVNYDVLRQANVSFRVDDGRNYLALTNRRYDVITADIIQPIHAGAGNLYSAEYFRLARRALADGGVMLQWIGHRPATQYKLIMRTFLSVFPETTVWADGGLLVGSKQPLQLSRPGLERQLNAGPTRRALDAIGLSTIDAVRALYTCGAARARAFAGGGPILTDNRPMLEYYRSLPANDPMVDVAPLRAPAPPLSIREDDRFTRNTPRDQSR
jgi:spermidine synthase